MRSPIVSVALCALGPALAFAPCFAIWSGGPAMAARSVQAPPVMLWAWEWPQDLSFLSNRGGAEVGVAMLASTVRLETGGSRVLPRR